MPGQRSAGTLLASPQGPICTGPTTLGPPLLPADVEEGGPAGFGVGHPPPLEVHQGRKTP